MNEMHDSDHTGQVISVNETKEQFDAARKGKIGSSDISAILGLNRHRTPLAVWCEKTGKTEEKVDNEFTRAGKALEGAIAALFTQETGIPVGRCQKTYQSVSAPWAVATPDGISTDEEGEVWINEIKNVSEYSRDDWEGVNVPDHAHIQTIWQMGITGIRKARVIALIGGHSLVHREVAWDPELFKIIFSAVTEFYERVVKQIPPPSKGQDETLITKLWGYSKDEVFEDIGAEPTAERYLEAKARRDHARAAVKEIEQEMEKFEMQLRDRMKGAALLLAGRYKAAVKKVERKGYTVAPSEYFTFTVKEA